jgi:hypothetical protein
LRLGALGGGQWKVPADDKRDDKPRYGPFHIREKKFQDFMAQRQIEKLVRPDNLRLIPFIKQVKIVKLFTKSLAALRVVCLSSRVAWCDFYFFRAGRWGPDHGAWQKTFDGSRDFSRIRASGVLFHANAFSGTNPGGDKNITRCQRFFRSGPIGCL